MAENSNPVKKPSVNKKKRGRPRTIDENVVLTALTQFKDLISPNNDGRIVSKNDHVWKKIAKELNHVKSEEALYTYVVCNHDRVRSRLWPLASSDSCSEDDDVDIVHSILEHSTIESASESESPFNFQIHVPASQFDNLVELRIVYHRQKPRTVKKFRKGMWQEFITQKIWKCTRLKCAFNSNYHYLSTECTSGIITGRCRCGSQLNCIIERDEDDVVSINCSTTPPIGDQECGKRYVRGSARTELGKKLQGKSAHVVRCEMANEMMNDGDVEPPHLPSMEVMRTIKSQTAASYYLHPNPIVALEILSTYKMKGEIPWIGHKPFFVHYSTMHQRTIYTNASEGQHVSLAIDATGSIITPINRANKTNSAPIFLYVAVLTTSASPLSVAQMLSERQTTGAIHFWLTQWIEQWGLAPPREIICDASTALLSSAVRAFTTKNTINQYADLFFTNDLPAYYIRIDVAHFVKTWVDCMRDVRSEVGKFYKVGIGKLIMCRNIEDAKLIVRALLTIARSKNCGKTVDGRMSACDRRKAYMKQVITTNILEELDLEDEWTEEAVTEAEQVDNCQAKSNRSRAEPSKWREWGQKIDALVVEDIGQAVGTDVNAHWLPSFADRLIENLKWLPLWSCVIRDKYGYGRSPASSAHVEAEFRIIKNLLLKDMDGRLRPDVFIQKHKNYIDGICKLDEAKIAMERQRRRRMQNQSGDDFITDTTNEGSIVTVDKNNNPPSMNIEHSGNESKLTDNDLSLGSPFSQPVMHSSPIEISTPTKDCLIPHGKIYMCMHIYAIYSYNMYVIYI